MLARWSPHAPTEPQQVFLDLHCEEALYGGAASGGKSDALLMAALQHVDTPGYAALLLRRSYADLALPGALMDRAGAWLQGSDARWRDTEHTWHFPSGATITFGYLETENSKYRYQCFHPDTEMLTEAGWKNVADVSAGEQAATIDPSTREMVYAPVTKTWACDFVGELVALDQRQGAAFAVTPNHTVWASTNTRSTLKPYRADELPYTARIPQTAGVWVGEGPEEQVVFASPGNHGKTIGFSTALWMEFLGWYLAEGCCDVPRWAVRLSQVNEYGRSAIRSLLDQMGVNYHEMPREFSFNNRALVEYLLPLGLSGDKYMPAAIKRYPRALLERLLHSLVEGDGTWRDGDHRVGHFVTSSPRLADDVCEIAVKCGYRPTVSLRQGNSEDSSYGTKPRYHVSLMRRDRDTMVMGRTSRVSYSGKVHCVTVPPHHTVLIRYHGRVSWSGNSAEFQMVGFDELTQFSETQYTYLFSRLRRLRGSDVPIRMRTASNPGGVGHDWVRQRFVASHDDLERVFVPARVEDNPYVDQEAYKRSLDKLDAVTRAQLLEGNWDVLPQGDLFKREYFKEILPERPAFLTHWVRYWDKAGTKGAGDWTAGVLIGKAGATFYVLDVVRGQWSSAQRNAVMKQTTQMDGHECPRYSVWVEQEPGSGGKESAELTVADLAGYDAHKEPVSGSKLTRARPFAAQCEVGNVKLISGSWNSAYLTEVCAFTGDDKKDVHDDQVDASSGAFNKLCAAQHSGGSEEYAR